MKTSCGTVKTAFSVTILAAAVASLANAQCVKLGSFQQSASPHRSWVGVVSPAVFSADGYASLKTSPAAEQEPIVGFWKVKLLSEHNPGVPDGKVLDQGYAQWHSDGTEIMNSSRPPATSSFCLGVWEKTGPSTYKLNHFAISWNPNGTLQGPANLQETVTVSKDQKSFTGTFSIDQYDEKGTLLAHQGGRIEAMRITATTPAHDALLD
jgi:hypothetical protein